MQVRMKCKKVIGILLAVAVIMSMVPLSAKASDSDWMNAKEAAEEYMYSLLEKNPVYGSEWLVIDLARGGCDISGQVFTDYYENLVSTLKEKEGILSGSRYTEYSKAVIAVKAIGRDPSDVGGYDLLSKLTEVSNVEKQGINGPVWALIAMDACGYESEVKDEYIRYILESPLRLSEGGWKLSSSGTLMDVDITSMVICSLAPYYETDADVKAAVDGAVTALQAAENDDGTYSETKGGTPSVESTAQVISALSILGKECGDTAAAMMSFRAGNGFANKQGGDINVMGTEQALAALIAYDRFKSGNCSIYDISADTSPVVIEAPAKTVLTMSALSNERMSLKWKAVSGAKGYQVMFNGKTYTVSACQKTFTGLTAYKVYKGKVRAFKYVNGKKVYGAWSAEKSVKATYTAPGKPVISSLKSSKSRSLTVKWKKVSYAKGYQLGYRKAGGTYKYVYVTSLSKSITKLTSKKTYYVKVRAYKVVNGKKKYGSWSSVKTVKVK